MTNEQTAYISPGQNLAILCLKQWLKNIPRSDYPSIEETHALIEAVSLRMDNKILKEQRHPTQMNSEEIETLIEDSTAHLGINWIMMGSFTWAGLKLFKPTRECEMDMLARLGGCSGG